MVKTFVFNHFAENTYLVYSKQGDCVIVDPGNTAPSDREQISNFISEKKLVVQGVLLTHPHMDHLCGAADICSFYHKPLFLHSEAVGLLDSVMMSAEAMGFKPSDLSGIEKKFLNYGEKQNFGSLSFDIIDVSGHAPGSVAYYFKEDACVFVGDSVFFESIGRTDLIGGDLDLLLHNIKTNLFALPPETVIYPGHGPKTDIDYEAANNPYINGFDI